MPSNYLINDWVCYWSDLMTETYEKAVSKHKANKTDKALLELSRNFDAHNKFTSYTFATVCQIKEISVTNKEKLTAIWSNALLEAKSSYQIVHSDRFDEFMNLSKAELIKWLNTK